MLAVLASYGVVSPVTVANAATVTGSTFEIDSNANLKVDGAGLDWLIGGTGTSLRSDVVLKDDLPTGGGDDSFTGGTKNDSATPTVDTGSVPNNKSDLTHFGTYVEKAGSATFVNVFWTRVQDPNGTTAIDFEFNQLNTNNNNWGPQPPPYYPTEVIPKRWPGDLLLTYELGNGGTNPTLSRRTWSGSAWGPATVFDATQALGSINTSAIPANEAGSLGAIGARTFGEASISLAALVPDQTTCTTFGSVYVKSRASDVLDEELKDFIAPEPVTISNCGSVKIHKTQSLGNGTPIALAGAGFTLYKDVAPAVGINSTTAAGPEDTIAANIVGTPTPCITDALGDCTITNVPKGSYWLVETGVPLGHDGAADQPVSITAGDQLVEFTLNDPIQTGTITVVKDAVPNDAQDFTFTIDGTPFVLDDDPTSATPNSLDFKVPVGSHSVSETAIPSPWALTGLTCTTGGTGSVATATASITLVKDQHVTCTFTNKPSAATPDLQTKTVSAGANGWDDGATVTGDGVHAVTGTIDFYACAPTAIATSCAPSQGTQVGTSVSVSAGAAKTSTPWQPSGAGWTCFRAVFTSSSAFYSDTEHTNTGTECFFKPAQNLVVTKTATAAFGRLYSWTIDKSVNATRVTIPAGGTATSDYAVTIGNTHVDGAWTVTGNITVTNSNPVAFTGVTVTDAIDNGAGNCSVLSGTGVTVPPRVAAVDGTAVVSYTCTYTTAPSPVTGTNTATATWDGTAFFTPASSSTGTATVDFSKVTPSTTDQSVTLSDTVKGSLGTFDATTMRPNPTVIHYSVDRSGNAGKCTTYPNTASFVTSTSGSTGSKSASVDVCVGSDLTVATTADGGKSRDDQWSIVKNVDKTRVEMAAGNTAVFNYEVTVTPTGSVDSGYTLSGLVTVSNPNNWEDITATVTDVTSVGGGATCTVTGGASVVVPRSGSVQLPYSCSFTSTPAATGTDTATATWSAATYSTPTGTASSTPASVSFAVGTETHSTVTVVDDKTDPANPVTLGTQKFSDPVTTYKYSLRKAGVAGQCTSYNNIASLTETHQSATKSVTVCVGSNLTVTKTALATDHRTHLWSIDKSVDQTVRSVPSGGTANYTYTVTATPTGSTVDGWSVTGQITVTNPNHWEGITATVTDLVSSGGGANCQVGSGSAVLIPALQSVQLSYACTFTSQPSDGTNTATATWDSETSSTPSGSATGTAAVVFVPRGVTNDTITVVDDKTDPAHPVTLGTASASNGATTFTYTLGKQAPAGSCTDFTNVASIVETGQSDSQVATVCGGDALSVVATADGSFDRTYLWGIDKTVDRTTVTAADGASVTFNYAVTVTPNGVQDSGYSLSGTVTVSNPNTWEDVVTDVTVTTDVGGGAACAVTDGVARTVPRSGSLALTYSCTFTGVPATTGTVSADAAWSAAAASTQVGDATSTTPAELLLAGQTNGSVTVVDDKTDPAHPVTLGTVAVGDGTKVFTYSLAKKAVGGVCTTYTNIASLTETGQSDSQAVTVCGTAFTGGGGGVVVPTAGGGGLAFTGDMTSALLRWALSLLGAGALLMLIGRRRATS